MSRNKVGKIPTIPMPVTFEVGRGFVTAVLHLGNNTIGLKFESPEQLLMFFTELMGSAALAWPNSEWIKLYLDDEG